MTAQKKRLFALLAILALVLGAASRLFGEFTADTAVHLAHFDAGPRVAVAASPGCGSAASGESGPMNGVIEADGARRTYELALPRGYDPKRPYPLVFAFHGSGGNGSGFHHYLKLEQEYGDGAITVYPDAVVRRIWAENFATHWGKVEDLPLVDALLARMKSTLCVDESRVFAVGWSSGGYFANQLGCVRPQAFRAIVALSGGGPENVTCTAPIAAFVHHDYDDHSVAFRDGRASRDTWVATNGCSGSRVETGCRTYADCKAPVVWCETREQGHGVPSSVRTAFWSFLAAF